MTETAPARHAAAVGAPHARRKTAVALSLIAPGLGHFARGRWRRGLFWYGLYLGCYGAGILGAVTGVAAVMAAGFGSLLLMQFAVAPWDASRIAAHTLPRRRYVAALALGVVVLLNIWPRKIREQVVEAFSIPSGAMYPTLEIGDQLMVQKVSRQFRRGDVVVFRYPLDPKISYVKRIVAVGGDTVASESGKLVVNGRPLATRPAGIRCRPQPGGGACTAWTEEHDGRTYTIARTDAQPLADLPPRQVPAGHYFVVGDNRDNSSDSRIWGPVPANLMVGKATLVHWSSTPGRIRWERVGQSLR